MLSEGWHQVQASVEYFIIYYPSTFIRLFHLYQVFYVHCVVINDWGIR